MKDAPSQPPELVVVPYVREQHQAAFLAFLSRVWGEEVCRRRRVVLDHIHDRMPGRERTPLRHLVLDGDRVAGTLGHLPADFLVRGERVPVRFTCDLLVDPAYAMAALRLGGRKTLGMLLVENARRQGDFFPGGMWMTPSSHQIHLAAGFDDAAGLTTYTLVLSPRTFVARRGLSRAGKNAAAAGLSVVRGWALARARLDSALGRTSLEAIDRFDPALDATWLALARGYSVTRVRDAAYLNWKYAGHPTLAYRNLLAGRGRECAGYLVWRTAPEQDVERRSIVADFLVARHDAGTFRLLLSRAIVESAAAGMESISILTTQPWAAAALKRMGFLPRKERSTWVVAGWSDHIPPEWLRDREAWHLCIGDSDGDLWTGTL